MVLLGGVQIPTLVVPFKCQSDVEVEVIATEIIKSQWPITKDRPRSKVKVFTAWMKLTNPKIMQENILEKKGAIGFGFTSGWKKTSLCMFFAIVQCGQKTNYFFN